jgi:hypothetical protein
MNKKIILFLSLFQIVLLINFVFAQGYNLSEEKIEISSEINLFKKFVKSNLDLLIGFFSIKQIGLVSAASGCCVQTSEGAFCQEEVLIENCVSSFSQSACDATSFCKQGFCVDVDGTCSQSSQAQCSNDWSSNEPEACNLGCCDLSNSNTQYQTQAWCELQGGNFDSTISETQCRYVSPSANGACVYQVGGENSCTFTSATECEGITGGDFKEGSLCSNVGLDTICEKQKSIDCLDGKVYWFDSCGNRENVYTSEGETDWYQGFVRPLEITPCTANENNLGTCGNCNSAFNICKKVESGGISFGGENFMCDDLGCDEDGDGINERKNGESWCIFEGRVGEYINDAIGVQISSDIPGTSHYRKSCSQGEITTENCGVYRNEICGEHTVTIGENESAISYTEAVCRPNVGPTCFEIDNVQDCEDEPDCRIQIIDVTGGSESYTVEDKTKSILARGTFNGPISDTQLLTGPSEETQDSNKDYFSFGVCVPKYSQGFNPDKYEEGTINDGESVCNLASIDCQVLQQYKLDSKCKVREAVLFGQGHCLLTIFTKVYLGYIANEECKENKEKFYSQMNDFCVSLGDCAGYINSVGNYTGRGNLKERYVGLNNTPEINNAPNYTSLASSTGSVSSIVLNLINSQLGNIPIDPEKTMSEEEKDLMKFRTANQIAGALGAASNNPYGWLVAAIAVVIELVLFNFIGAGDVGKVEKSEVTFSCEPWEPPSRSNDCEKCNDGEFPCNEYKCWSLGENCESLVEEEGVATDEVICVTKEIDPQPPVINLKANSYYPEGLNFEIQTDASGREIGIRITNSSNENNCVDGNILLNFNLTTDKDEENKFARCRWGTSPADLNTYKDVWDGRPVSGFVWTKEHEFSTRVSSFSDNCLGEDGEFNIYIRCEGHDGVAELNSYQVSMCVNPTPDIAPPIIEGFSPEDGSYLKFGNDTLSGLTIYTNEPASECKYSLNELTNYNDMTQSITCEGYQYNDDGTCFPRLEYGCDFADITGLSTTTPTKIYFKCNDTQGNINIIYKEYTINPSISTLKITSATPTGYNQVSSSTGNYKMNLRVTTSGGADGTGAAKCYYPSGDLLSSNLEANLLFANTGSTVHTQELSLTGGDYEIPIKCEDATGNSVETKIIFTLYIDNTAPEITAIYRSGSLLGIKTHKESWCYYDNNPTQQCNPEINSTNLMSPSTSLSIEHTVTWNSEETYHIKCEDKLGNIGTCVSIVPSVF